MPINTLFVITRDPPLTQNYLLGQGATINSAALTNQLDYLTLLNQRLDDRLDRGMILPDGFADTFDPTIPVSIARSPNSYLLVNASGTGWTTSSSAFSAGGGAPSASSFVGVLQQVNGGTGTTVYVSGSGAVQLANYVSGSGAVQLSQYVSGSGALQISQYAAGSSSLLIVNNLSDVASATQAFKNINPMTAQGDIIVAGSGAIAQRLAAGPSTFLLTANGSSALLTWTAPPAAGAPAGSSALLVVNNLSDVAAKAPAFNNVSPNNTQGDISWYQGSSNVKLPVGAANTFLQVGSGSSLQWASSAGAAFALSTKNANYNALTSDDIILAGSGCALINLYGPTGNSGKVLKIKKTDASKNIVTIAGSSATIDGTSVFMGVQYEALDLVCDGTNWNILNRQIPTIAARWIAASCALSAGFTTPGWKTLDYDTHGIVNGSTGVITINRAGKWDVSCHLTHNYTAVAGDACQLALRKNVTIVAQAITDIGTSSAAQDLYVGSVLTLAVNDTIDVQTLNQNTTPTIAANSTAWICAVFIGP